MNQKEMLFNLGVSLVINELERKANGKYGLSSGKVWYALEGIVDKGVEWNIPGYRSGGNAMDHIFAKMGINPASLATQVTAAETEAEAPQ